MEMKTYVITWYCNAVKPSKRSKYVLDLGYCEFGKEIAFVTLPHKKDAPMNMNTIKPFMIRDVIVGDGVCEDAKWCLNLSCSLNKADLDYWRKRKVLKKKEGIEVLQKFHSNLQKFSSELELSSKGLGVIEIYPKSPIYFTKLRKQTERERLV